MRNNFDLDKESVSIALSFDFAFSFFITLLFQFCSLPYQLAVPR